MVVVGCPLWPLSCSVGEQLAFSKYVDTFAVRPKGTAFVPSASLFAANFESEALAVIDEDVDDDGRGLWLLWRQVVSRC